MPHSTILGAALIASASACYGGGAFQCETNDQCSTTGVAGVCQPDHFCSFADASCPLGQRYGDSSGSKSGTCVGGGLDGGTDGSGDARLCYGGGLTICLTAPPSQPLVLGPTVNTDTDCQQLVDQTNGPLLCVLAGTTVVANSTRAVGGRPLVLIAADTLTINTVLDASSGAAGSGAGANAVDCSRAGGGADDFGGGGGGAGGSFGTMGADGGHGDDNNNGLPIGIAPGGGAGATQTPAVVRGGCNGGHGGSSGGGGGTGGDGGGAMYLIAGNQIAVNGNAYASGSGGAGGPACDGGGGGGSGGMIGLDAPMIVVTGEVAANGGAGGGGGGTTNNGIRGGDGTSTAYDQKPQGGTAGATGGGNGGDGTALGNLTGETGFKGDCGGGGGGAGVGYIWVHGTLTGTKLSPPTTPH